MSNVAKFNPCSMFTYLSVGSTHMLLVLSPVVLVEFSKHALKSTFIYSVHHQDIPLHHGPTSHAMEDWSSLKSPQRTSGIRRGTLGNFGQEVHLAHRVTHVALKNTKKKHLPIGSMYGIYANIGGILMVNATIYSIHGSYGLYFCQTNLSLTWI